MYANRITRNSFSMLSMLLCAAVIAGCGASKEAKKKAGVTTAAPVPMDGGSPATGATTGSTTVVALPTPTPDTAAPLGQQNEGAVVGELEDGEVQDTSAPVGRINEENKTEDEKLSEESNSVPTFTEVVAGKTGGKVGELDYTSNSDDGVMEYFRSVSTTVSKAQQDMNSNLAQAIVGAKLKNGSLDLAIDEFGQKKIYKLKASADGNKMKLTSVSAAGDLEFQDGFVKCLDASCDNAYAKIKMSGAYTRIIFRTASMNNHFLIQKDVQEDGFSLWKTYIQNTIQGAQTSAKIESVKASSYEILNGKSAMGVQLTTQDNEAVVLNTLLVAPENGTELNQKITKVTDLSMNYNLAPTAGKLNTLSSKVLDTSLVNNNGKGQVKIKLNFSSGSIWMVLSKVKSKSMSVAEIKAFEDALPKF